MELGLIVVNIAAADKQTAGAFHTALAAAWVTTATERTSGPGGCPGSGCAASLTCTRPSAPSGPAGSSPLVRLTRRGLSGFRPVGLPSGFLSPATSSFRQLVTIRR
ncbi:hypothetical protein GCM10017687_65570 [Streptomyces echinatus]